MSEVTFDMTGCGFLERFVNQPALVGGDGSAGLGELAGHHLPTKLNPQLLKADNYIRGN